MMVQQQTLELLIGTRNLGKVREIQDLLSDLPITLRSLDDFTSIPDVEEVGATYGENSELKALTYAKLSRVPTLADDSGLEVDGLDGLPGPMSARFGGEHASDSDRIRKLLMLLNQRNSAVRSARFVCCLTLAGWDNQRSDNEQSPVVIKVFRDELRGEIVSEARGSNGFGYDPIFVPTGFTDTLAELPAETKNRISHRGKALAQMKTFLAARIRQT